MSNKVRVALLGLGSVGEIFAENFLRSEEHTSELQSPTTISRRGFAGSQGLRSRLSGERRRIRITQMGQALNQAMAAEAQHWPPTFWATTPTSAARPCHATHRAISPTVGRAG